MNTLDSKFFELKSSEFSDKQVKNGYFTILRLQKPTIYLKIGWEIITTILIYSPGICSYWREIISTIRAKWNTLDAVHQENIIAALVKLNKKGKIEKYLQDTV